MNLNKYNKKFFAEASAKIQSAEKDFSAAKALKMSTKKLIKVKEERAEFISSFELTELSRDLAQAKLLEKRGNEKMQGLTAFVLKKLKYDWNGRKESIPVEVIAKEAERLGVKLSECEALTVKTLFYKVGNRLGKDGFFIQSTGKDAGRFLRILTDFVVSAGAIDSPKLEKAIEFVKAKEVVFDKDEVNRLALEIRESQAWEKLTEKVSFDRYLAKPESKPNATIQA